MKEVAGNPHSKLSLLQGLCSTHRGRCVLRLKRGSFAPSVWHPYLLQAFHMPTGGQQLTLGHLVPPEFPKNIARSLGGLIRCHCPLLLHPQHERCHVLLPFLPETQETAGLSAQGQGLALDLSLEIGVSGTPWGKAGSRTNPSVQGRWSLRLLLSKWGQGTGTLCPETRSTAQVCTLLVTAAHARPSCPKLAEGLGGTWSGLTQLGAV